MSRNDIVRAVGGAIWNRASGLRVEYDRDVRHEAVSVDGGRVETFHTPLGSIRQVYREAEGPHRAKFLAEHYVKDLESLRIRKYVVEATRHAPNYEPARQALRETGDDGVGMSDNVPPDADFTRVEAVAGRSPSAPARHGLDSAKR
jgi:hypothetical protein